MALSDCTDCWETPCCCGKYWSDHTNEATIEHVLSVVKRKSKEDALIILKTALEQKNNE